MHKHKRVLTSAIALLLCFLTVFSCAFANSKQQATSGYPQPPTYKGGNNSGNSHTSYTDPVIVGYRFTCWRSTDWLVAEQQGLLNNENAQDFYEAHNEKGYKLGHSINIMVNASTSDGGSRTDYANAYNQTGLKMPHMLTNGEQTDFLDKISVAQDEQETDASNPNKITHSTATGLMLMDYSGSANGKLTSVDESSWFEFTQPIYTTLINTTREPTPLSTAFTQEFSKRNPLIIYSGYNTRTQWDDAYLNGSPENDFEANNLYTYIYGFKYNSQMGDSHTGKDFSENYLTISDIDYEDLTGDAPVLPFNQDPANIIQSGNDNTWTNRNALLIATLCGLTPAYEKTAAQCTDDEFGLYDYIIVEPIMMYYYYYTRYYVTTGDTCLLQAQSMYDKVGNTKDVWTSVYYHGYKLFDVCGKFPAVYGTYLYTEEQFFGVDGVFNATTQQGYPNNAFQTSRDGLALSSIQSDSNNKSGNADRNHQNGGFNTYAFVFTTNSGYTLFGGGDSTMDRAVDMGAQMRIRDGQNSFFLAPYIGVESLIGTGIYWTYSGTPLETTYRIVYHPNTNSGGANNADVTVQTIQPESNSMKFLSYQTALINRGLQPTGKIPTSYWTFTDGPNGYGIQDNTINNITQTYPNTSKDTGKVDVQTSINGWENIKTFFNTYGNYLPAENALEVHVYAAWNTKSLVTTLDRTYNSANAQTLQSAALYDPSGSMWFTDSNYLPTAISVVATTKGTYTVQDVIQLQKDTSTGYQWFQASGDTGNLDNSAYDYYVVYSYDKSAITDSDKSAIQKALNKQDQNTLLIYRNNGAPVKWTSDTNLFYFDYYSFDISAPNCSVNAIISNYPDADNTITKQSSNGVLQLILARGSSITYTVTPDYKNGYYFDTAIDFATFLNWENANGTTAHIKTTPDKKSAQEAKTAGQLAWQTIKHCNSCGKESWDSTATKCPGCNSTNYSSYQARMYYPTTSASKEVLGKQSHTYTVKTGKTVKVIPYVDGVQMEPFDNYFVDIVNVATGQTYIYSATPMNGAIEIPSNAKGQVSQAMAGDSQYYILASVTDGSGRNQMKTIQVINTSSVPEGGEITVEVHYYTSSITIKTQSGGNHSGITGTLYYTPDGVNDIDQAYSFVSTDACAGSGTCPLCSEQNYSHAEGVALAGTQLNISRDSNPDWYLTSVKKNDTAQTIHANLQYASGIESVGATSYNQTYLIQNRYHVEYVAAPYHYITAYVDGQQVHVTDIGINADANHSVAVDMNGYKGLKGKYNTSISSISSIISATSNKHADTSADKLSLSYSKDAVTYTTLYYYTVTTDADKGYSGTQITSAGGTNMGTKAWVLSYQDNYEMFVSCSSGKPKETSVITNNTRTYTGNATLSGSNTYADTSVTGKMTVDGTKYTSNATFVKSSGTKTSSTFTKVNAASTLYWRSNQTRYDLKFIFRINDVPYDSLPETINNIISLDGNNQLTFSTDANGNVVATGKAIAGYYNLFLGGMDTGMEYQVKESNTANVYYIDFYTLRAAAGTGITNVSIAPTDKGNNVWNGTLPYYRDGRKFATTLAIWPKSMTSETKNIYVDARADGEYTAYDSNGNPYIATTEGGYSFKRWDTKRPSSPTITYKGSNNGTTTTVRAETIDASKIAHATVVQAEATTQGTPIDIPTVPEHNSIYYGVKVRTFLDGRLKTPWSGMSTDMTLVDGQAPYRTDVINGVAPWATVLDLYKPMTAAQIAAGASHGDPITDPYNGKSASALLAPSYEFENNSEINTEYFYSGSNAYIANQYTYIDAFYYTQTVQTQVNGVNTPPWNVGQYKEVMYRQMYKGLKVNTTILTSVNDAGAFQTIMLKGMKINVGGLPVASTTATADKYNRLYTDFEITGNHAFIIPYYTVDMKAYCDTSEENLSCNTLKLTFNGTDLTTSVSTSTPALVMEGSYSISAWDGDWGNANHSDAHYGHSFLRWDLLANEVFILEYVDSGDGENPYPVLTYTGESRPSNSVVANSATASTSVNVCDETHLMAVYKDVNQPSYNLTLYSHYYDENGNELTTGVNPITMFRGNNNGDKAEAIDGKTYAYSSGAHVNISGVLDPQTIYYPKSISVTMKLTCPYCNQSIAYDSTVTKCTSCGEKLGLQNATSADVSEIYYATADSYAQVKKIIGEAKMMTPDAAAEYLAANNVVPMTKTAAGTYTGTIPYAEDAYHLYINGEKQGSSYDALNNKKKEFVWGKPGATNIVWSGTAGINNGTATSTQYSDFYVVMNQNREYHAYARQVVTGTQPSNKSIDFICATIYTSTDYATQLPYNTTYVYINGNKTPLASAAGHTFFVAKGSNLEIRAQRAANGTAFHTVYNGTINAKKTFLLSYNTVTVSGDANLVVGIDGTGSQKETWLANYAVDGGAFQSANTVYGVFAQGGSISNKTFYHMDSTVTVNTTAGQNIQLVATRPSLTDNQELVEGFTGSASAQYLYILENTAANKELLKNYSLSQHDSVTEKYLIGFSTNNAIPGNLAKTNAVTNFKTGVSYDVIVDWSDMSVNVIASEGTRFNAGTAGSNNAYVFYNVPNGQYEIHMNGSLLITNAADITSVSGVVSKDTSHKITITTTAVTKTSSGTAFKQWAIDNTPGTAATNKAVAGTKSNSTNTAPGIANQVLTGTINYVASSTSGTGTQTGSASGTVTLPAIIGYKVEVYLDNKLNTTFPKPVKFNGSTIEIDEGESDTLYSITFPTVSAVADSHDTGYTELYGESPAITFDSATNTFKVYYYSVTYGVDPDNGTLGEVLAPDLCNPEAWNGATIVAKGSKVTLNVATLDISNHTRIAATKQVAGYTVTFQGWTKNENESVPTTITEPTHFIAHFIAGGGTEYTVTLYNKSATFTGYLLDMLDDSRDKVTLYGIEQTKMTKGTPATVTGTAPKSIAAVYLYGNQSYMYAYPETPTIVGTSNDTVDITLTLTGYTSELAHKVQIKNVSTGTVYTSNVAANAFVAKFTNVPTGVYQLYVDDIKYVTKFDYNTHDDSCKVTGEDGTTIHTPQYETEISGGGLIYVAPIYTVRYSEVSHWSQVRYDRVNNEYIEYSNLTVCNDTKCSGYGKHANVDHFKNWTSLDEMMDPTVIRYRYVCNECGKTFQRNQTGSWSNAKHTACPTSAGGCGSTHIRMTSAELVSCEIDENLDYYVYSTYTDKNYAPLDISAEVEMAYPVYVQAVVDGTERYPFLANGNTGTPIAGAKVFFQYSADGGNTWGNLEAAFDEDGLATVFVPMGTIYRIVGAHSDEWAMSRTSNNVIDGGFSLNKPYSTTGLDTATYSGKRYIIGDGDYNNDSAIDDPGLKYYVHYYTVTAKAGHGIDDVNNLSVTNQSKYATDSSTTVATYQRGATARVNGAIADGKLPVYIRIVNDNETYTGREVYLSTSKTSNTKTWKLTYNSSTGRYEHTGVSGTAAGTTYYVWANGKLVNGAYTDEYTGVDVLVKPYILPVGWSGNCGHCLQHVHGLTSNPFEHNQTYNCEELCSSACNNSEANHCVFDTTDHDARNTSTTHAPYTHTFTVYHTTVEQLDASDNIAQYFYRYVDDHPTDPSDPDWDPEDPDNDPDTHPDPDPNDKLDDFPQNTVYYYTLEVTGDAGIKQTSGTGTYLEGDKPQVNATIQDVRSDVGRTPITVKLYLDGLAWGGQTVTIGGYPAKETSHGVYTTDYNFASGTYAVRVTSPNTTLLDTKGLYSDTTVYGYITVSSTRQYYWKAWTDGHVNCETCGVKGACCDTDGTPTICNPSSRRYCTNCHIFLDANAKEQSCCTNGTGHNWTDCPYNSDVYSGDCLHNLLTAQTNRVNNILIKHNSKLHGVTTHQDTFKFTGDNSINFYTLHLDGDAGVDSIYIDGKEYEETTTITTHGKTADLSSTVYHRDLPERLWTNTKNATTIFKEVVVRKDRDTSIKVDAKTPVKNHAEAKTALSIELLLNGKPYTGRVVTIGGYAATDADNDGIYVTSYAGFTGGKTYQVTVDGRNAGRIYLESYRSYRWYQWSEPWLANGGENTSHYCLTHKATHSCQGCTETLSGGVYANANTSVDAAHQVYLVGRTEIIDEFHVYVDPNLNGGPDPYEPETGDPDDPYKDPTDDDFTGDAPNQDGTPKDEYNPEKQPNPEYNPDHKPTDKPEYDPVNPGTPVDPSKDPNNFDPDNENDGFYEDAPIPFYTLTINMKLNDVATDDFPIKFENLTSGETLYIIPDGQTYYVYDKDGKQLSNVPYIVEIKDGTVVIALQDGDKYKVSVLDEIEDVNNNDVIDILDIMDADENGTLSATEIASNTLDDRTYTLHTEGAIDGAPQTVNIYFYTLTLDVYSDGAHKLPQYGKTSNGTVNVFDSPVWLDDVHATQDGIKNFWGEQNANADDGIADTDYYAVQDAHTVKVYLKGQPYDVNVKTADDDVTDRSQNVGTGYLVDYTNGTVNGAVSIRVDYFSMTADHHGGFTGTQINYGGKTHVSAKTPVGATSNATVQAFFLKGTQIEIDATVAGENTWYRWTGTETYTTKNQKNIVMDKQRNESAWAKTYYTVRYYLHDKNEGWYEVVEDGWTNKSVLTVIDNRNWNSETVTGEPNKYVNFDPFRTHSFSDPSAPTLATLRDVLTKGVNTTTIDVVVDENQVGGQSFVDFYYTRNGSVVDPTPDTPDVPDPTPEPPEAPTPTPQDPEDWDVDEEKEYVTITYMVDDPTKDGIDYKQVAKETYLAGTDITFITAPSYTEQDENKTPYEFVGWFINPLDPATESANGMLGSSKDHYLLCKDTIVYAVYLDGLDLGITANDIYGVIKTGSQFTSSATIVNHNNSSITSNTHINAILTVKENGTVIDTIKLSDIIAPGNGTQMISTVVDTTKWNTGKQYTLTWSLDFSETLYVDKNSSNNQSSLNSFYPGAYSVVCNTNRPDRFDEGTTRPGTFNPNTTPMNTSNTAFYWEYWTWNENSGYNGKFELKTGNDKMNVVIILTPENASGLRSYTTGAFNIHNYTTRSGYGLSMHRVYDDLTGKYKSGAEWMAGANWPVNKSHITMESTVGTLEALMTFPEFNFSSKYITGEPIDKQEYLKLTVANAGTYYSLTMPQYADYETDDYNDQFAHYTPVWLPDGEYKPVTHISGIWTPIGELRATVQQGQYTTETDMHKFGVYTNEVIIKGSLYDDLYNNP